MIFRLSLSILVAPLLLAPTSARAAPQVLSPVIVGYSNESGRIPFDEKSMTACGTAITNGYPNQFAPDGKSRSVISSVSSLGDLTHEGGARWILEVRVAGTPTVAVNALIATPETVASLANPTWYYVPATDDGVDHVLLDTSTYVPEAAAWSPRVVGGTLKVAFSGTGPGGSGLYVGWVAWGPGGPFGTLQDITLVAPGTFRGSCSGSPQYSWKWGTADTLVLTLPHSPGNEQAWIADVSAIPAAPVVVPTGVVGDQLGASLSRDGSSLAYSGVTASGRAVFVRSLATSLTRQLPTGNGLHSQTIRGTEWSPDDRDIAFTAYPNGSAMPAIFKVAASGSSQPKKLASARNDGSGGFLVRWIVWRR